MYKLTHLSMNASRSQSEEAFDTSGPRMQLASTDARMTNGMPKIVKWVLVNTYQQLLDGLVVGDDAVVDHSEFVQRVTGMRVRVSGLGRTVSGPASVRNPSVIVQNNALVNPLVLQLQFGLCLQGVNVASRLDDQRIASFWLMQNAMLQSMTLLDSQAPAVVQVD